MNNFNQNQAGQQAPELKKNGVNFAGIVGKIESKPARNGGFNVFILLIKNKQKKNPNTQQWEAAGKVILNVVFFAKNSGCLPPTLQVGDTLSVGGKLDMDTWTDTHTGQPRDKLKVICDTVFGYKQKSQSQGFQPQQSQQPQQGFQPQQPQQPQQGFQPQQPQQPQQGFQPQNYHQRAS